MKQIKVGLATCGISAGGEAVFAAIKSKLDATKTKAELLETGCVGMCYNEVLVEVLDGDKSHLYYDVTPEKVGRIVDEDVIGGKAISEWLVSGPGVNREAAFFDKQKRIVLRNCGIIDPGSITDYLDREGYQGIRKALAEFTPEQVIEMIQASGLRGRGGGGFSTGLKWKFARMAKGNKKYIICNADEGDPGAFMDRSVLEGDPHAVIEGMMVAAYAIGADEGYLYVRAEYPKAIQRLREAISQCEERGFLGKGIFDSEINLILHIKEGAGAFVCGEETALIASIEGKRGVPRMRPPFPANRGLWDKPTNINNVETYANVPWIMRNGAEAYAVLGTERSKGTKVFALAGKIAKSGLVEVPMGITINEIVFDIGGGIRDGKAFKAVQMGGPSGGCIPASMGDLSIDYDEITKTGAIMGSGGMVVLDETTCMVDVAKYFLTFTQNESCGKCTFCRIGTKRMLEVLERITEGRGREGDIDLLEDLADKIKSSSLCGLGQTAPNPVLTTLKYFREEYEAHIRDKRCPAHVCKALISYRINPETCVGCTLCSRKCPVNAISGEAKKPHIIDPNACIKCGLCHEVCRFDAVVIE